MKTDDKDNSNNVVDLGKIREEIEDIRREALTYGFALDAEKPVGELRKAIEKIRGERAGKPPCYRRSYLSTAPQCRICDLVTDCAQPEVPPAYLPPEDLVTVPCDKCKQGTLIIELTDASTGSVRDYGCTTAGCTQTLIHQQKYIPPKIKKPIQNVEKKKKKTRRPSLTAVNMSTEELDHAIVNAVRDHRIVSSKETLVALIPAGRQRIQRRIEVLVKNARLRYRKKTGYTIPTY